MNTNRILAVSASVAVAVVIGIGLYIVGTPAEQRLMRFDDRRVAELRLLSRAISRHWDQTESLPKVLEELVDGQRLMSIPLDPVTDVRYIYEPISGSEYRLCAKFSRESGKLKANDFWAHEAGIHCFNFKMRSKQKTTADPS